MFNSPDPLRRIFIATLESALQKSKKLYPPPTHNSAPSGAANKQGSLNDMGSFGSPPDWAWATFGQQPGGMVFRNPSSSIWTAPMKIHNASDKFIKVHGKSLAHALAQQLSKPSYSYEGAIIRIWTAELAFAYDLKDAEKPSKIRTLDFEIARNPKTHELELTPANEETLLLIQEWEERNKDNYNDQAIY